MSPFWLSGCSATVCALWALPAFAQTSEDRHSDIVVTATRSPIAQQDAPATVSVKTDAEIADELATDIKDLVRFEPGVSVRRGPTRFGAALGTTGRAGNEGFVIRGIGGNRVLIQVDSVRVPYGFTFGAQDAGRGDYVDIGLVKSVEFLRGPASALYGSDGLAGAVSFVTSDPADILRDADLGGLARAQYNSADNEFSETAILAARSGSVSAMVAYTRRDFNELENQGEVGGQGATRTIANPQDGRSNAVLGKLVYDAGGGHRLRLTGEYLDTRLSTDVLSGRSATVDNLAALDTGRRWRTAVDWTWDGAGAVEFARAAAYLQDANDRQFTDEDRTPAADRERLNTLENRVYGASAEARLRFTTGGIAHRIVAGGDVSVLRQRGLRDGTVPPFGEVFPTRAFPTTDFTLVGAFLGDELTLGPVTLYPALRFDHYRLSPRNDALLPGFATAGQTGERVSPKIGAVVKLGEAVRLFGNYAQGFRAPEPGQINQFFSNLASGYTSIPNPNLGPERSESYEGGIRILGPAVELSMTAFQANYRDFISQEVVGGAFTPANPAIFQFINLGSAKVKGAEARFEGRAASGFTGTLAISYAQGDQVAASGVRTPLSSVDPLKLVMGIGWREVAGRFGGQVIGTHSARKSLDATTGVCTGPCFRPDAFTILDATAFVRIGEALTVRAGIFNLFDEKYAWWSDVRGLAASSTITDAYTQPGRNGSVSLSYRF